MYLRQPRRTIQLFQRAGGYWSQKKKKKGKKIKTWRMKQRYGMFSEATCEGTWVFRLPWMLSVGCRRQETCPSLFTSAECFSFGIFDLSRGNRQQCSLPRNMAPLPSPLKSPPSCSPVASACLSFSRGGVHKLHRSSWKFLAANSKQEGTDFFHFTDSAESMPVTQSKWSTIQEAGRVDVF